MVTVSTSRIIMRLESRDSATSKKQSSLIPRSPHQNYTIQQKGLPYDSPFPTTYFSGLLLFQRSLCRCQSGDRDPER